MTECLCIVLAKFFVFIFCALIVISIKEISHELGGGLGGRSTHATILLELTFVGPCIVIYFCSKTNQMHNISNLFYFGTTLYMFRTVSLSIIRSLRLYIQH